MDFYMSARPGNSENGLPEVSSTGLESAARLSIEMRAGRSLTDLEWARARARLLELVTILRAWEHQTKTPEREVAPRVAFGIDVE